MPFLTYLQRSITFVVPGAVVSEVAKFLVVAKVNALKERPWGYSNRAEVFAAQYKARSGSVVPNVGVSRLLKKNFVTPWLVWSELTMVMQ
tara:strand:- start:1157 stop:1426 length:270 start_codon:yes stop_codon:yes gene_type:complete